MHAQPDLQGGALEQIAAWRTIDPTMPQPDGTGRFHSQYPVAAPLITSYKPEFKNQDS